jgi:DNA-binding response OmpR family regulator
MRILLVEDDWRIARALEETLRDRQYLVDLAANGEIRWELIQSFDYDLIVLDLMLPKIDGITLCKRLRAQGYLTPVLILKQVFFI